MSPRAAAPLSRADFHAAQGVLLVLREPPSTPPAKGQPAAVGANPAEGPEVLLAVWDARRATVDGDFLARNLGVDESTVLARVVEIASTPPLVEDGVEYLVDTATASTIRDGDLYGGVRVSMDAGVAGARVKLRLDVSTGDPVTPPPDVISYPALRPHHPALRILGYPLVVVLAEKLCTAIELGAGNSRLRDYADVWTLTGLHDINGNELAGALDATAAHRGVELRPLLPLIGDYALARASGYAAYLRRLGPDASRLPRTLSDVIDGVVAFADPFLDPTVPHPTWWRSTRREWDG